MLFFTNSSYDLVDECNDLLVSFVAKEDSFDHLILGNFISTGLDHNNLLCGGCNSQIQIAYLSLCRSRIDHQLTIYQTYRNSTYRAGEGNIRDGYGDGGTNHCQNLRSAVLIYTKYSIHDGTIVTIILREQRSHGTIDTTSSQNRILAGTALSLQKASGNFTYGIHFFFIINAQREEIDTFSGLVRCSCGRQQGSLTIRQPYSTVGLLCHFADLSTQFAAGQLHFKNL